MAGIFDYLTNGWGGTPGLFNRPPDRPYDYDQPYQQPEQRTNRLVSRTGTVWRSPHAAVVTADAVC